MEWRRVGKGRIGSSKTGSKILRLIRSLGNREAGVVSAGFESETREQRVFNVQAYNEGTQRMHELETQKAMLISASRYPRWNAGGPN